MGRGHGVLSKNFPPQIALSTIDRQQSAVRPTAARRDVPALYSLFRQFTWPAGRAREYDNWKYRDVLERRIKLALQNVAQFDDKAAKSAIMIGSKFAYTGCHQQ
jgi:hypothetical protein